MFLFFLRQCEGSTLSLESAAGFERMPCRSVSQEALNEPVKNLHVRKQTPGKPVQRAQSQGDSVISGGSLQDRDSDFERSPLGRTRPPVVKTKYSRKFSDPQPLGLFPGHVSLTVYSSISAFTFWRQASYLIFGVNYSVYYFEVWLLWWKVKQYRVRLAMSMQSKLLRPFAYKVLFLANERSIRIHHNSFSRAKFHVYAFELKSLSTKLSNCFFL